MEKKIKILSIVMLSIALLLLAFGLTWIYFYNETFMEMLCGSVAIAVATIIIFVSMLILPDEPIKDNEEFINGFHAGLFYRANEVEDKEEDIQ